MTKLDVLQAHSIVVSFLKQNGTNNVFTSSSQLLYGVYVNYTCKSISIHGPKSQAWNNAYGNPSSNVSNVYNETQNGLWIGNFPSIEMAIAYAMLLSETLYLQTHEKSFVMTGNGITHGAFRIL